MNMKHIPILNSFVMQSTLIRCTYFHWLWLQEVASSLAKTVANHIKNYKNNFSPEKDTLQTDCKSGRI